MARDPRKHNASCFSCGDTYADSQVKKSGKNFIGVWHEGRRCQPCCRAGRDSGNNRMDRYTWKSYTEIEATWGQVHKGELWEKAVVKFAESLPVDESMKKRFVEAFNEKA